MASSQPTRSPSQAAEVVPDGLDVGRVIGRTVARADDIARSRTVGGDVEDRLAAVVPRTPGAGRARRSRSRRSRARRRRGRRAGRGSGSVRSGRAPRRRCTWRRRGADVDDRGDPSAASLPERGRSRRERWPADTPRGYHVGDRRRRRRRDAREDPTTDEPDRGAPRRAPRPTRATSATATRRTRPSSSAACRGWRARSAASPG